jgi:hypothetical protein
MDGGWPLHPISTSLPIAGPILIDLLIFYAIIRRISQLSEPFLLIHLSKESCGPRYRLHVRRSAQANDVESGSHLCHHCCRCVRYKASRSPNTRSSRCFRVFSFVPGLGGVAIKFGKPSTRVVHEIESYLSLRCAITWHQQLYGEEDFVHRLANAMCPKGKPMHNYRQLARDLKNYILYNRLPDPVAEKHSSVSAV